MRQILVIQVIFKTKAFLGEQTEFSGAYGLSTVQRFRIIMAKLQGLVTGVRAVYAVSDVCWP